VIAVSHSDWYSYWWCNG